MSATTDLHGRLLRLVADTDDDSLRHRARALLDFHDSITLAQFEGRADDAMTHDDMARLQAMANRLFRDILSVRVQ